MTLKFKAVDNPDRVLVTKDEIPFCTINFDGDIFNPGLTEEMSIDDPKLSAFLKACVKAYGEEINGIELTLPNKKKNGHT